MNTATLVLAYVRRQPLTWAFHVLILTLGVAVVVAVLLLQQALDERFTHDIGKVDLVVGAKGSPLQLILSSVFQIDAPAGNISLAAADRIAANPMVAVSAPVSMGDSVGGVRIVGTSPAYRDLYGLKLASGRWAGPMEAVLGAQARRLLGLRLGQSFVGEHGLARGGEPHAATPYRVVGILAPSGSAADRLVLTDTASVWRVHAAETDPSRPAEVTALLVHYRSPMGAVLMPQQVRAMPDLQAAVPAVEAARLNRLLGAGADVLRGFGAGLLAISAFGFFLALFAAVHRRRRELALLRTLGARPALLARIVAAEAVLLGLCSGLLGAAVARLAVGLLAARLAAHGGLVLSPPPPGLVEVLAVLSAVALALAAAVGPGVLAARLDPARTLRSAA